MKTFIAFLVAAALAGAAGFFLGHRSRSGWSDAGVAGAAEAGRKPIFYQSPMHPWVKSDKPGNCTICGMKLVPVYEKSEAFAGLLSRLGPAARGVAKRRRHRHRRSPPAPLRRTLRR